MAGLYIHIPFCRSKCAYCDFVSFPHKEDLHAAYIDAVIKELKRYPKEKIETIFIGGGTPSILKAELLERLVNAACAHFIFEDDPEFTIEANPCDLSKNTLSAFKGMGVNRLSIGLQSANDAELKMLGRAHNYAQFLDGYNTARNLGFNNINVDLISGLPNQSIECFEETLNKIVALNPEHISCYSLIIDDNTPLAKKINSGELPVPNEETDRQIYVLTRQVLAQHGYSRYEISNYAKPGRECRHNLNYWTCGSYIGLGVAASSYYNNIRYTNIESPQNYIRRINQNESVIGEKEYISEKDQLFETIMLGLRLTSGIDRRAFKDKFRKDILYYFRITIERFVNQGLMEITEQHVKLTEKGLDLADSVILEFMS